MNPAGLHPNCRLWLFCEQRTGVFGDGKVRLLKEIEQSGSLRQAALHLGISYRKAWGDLKKAEACLGVRLIERSRGGITGGQSLLTEDGRRWVEAWTVFSNAVRNHMNDEFAARLQPLLRDSLA